MNHQTLTINSKPFLKWAGGKTQLLPELISRLPAEFNTYYEPFLGGGALFFAVTPEKAILSDVNSELINAYEIVKYSPYSLYLVLNNLKTTHTKEQYYRVRGKDRLIMWDLTTKFDKAARFIYLNKTCFNGLHRVNKKGQFNVPEGKYKNPGIANKAVLTSCSEALHNASLRHQDYKLATALATKGDFIYFDPPYTPVSETADFTAYTSTGFSKNDQINLAKLCSTLDAIGVKWMLSNSDTQLTRSLYSRYNIETVQAKRSINSNSSKRGNVNELIVRNYR